MSDSPPAEAGGKREADGGQDGRSVKRKKVTWADDELEMPLASPVAGAAAQASSAHSSGTQAAVVVLPCDGLFDALTEELLLEQVDTPQPSSEPLSRHHLLERRLAHCNQLASLYEGQLWALLEELRLRHAQFQAQPGLSVWKRGPEGGGDSQEAAAAAEEGGSAAAEGQAKGGAAAAAADKAVGGGIGGMGTSGSLQKLWEQQQAERQAATAAAAAATAAPVDAGAGVKGEPAAAAKTGVAALKPGAAANPKEAAGKGQQQEAKAGSSTQQEPKGGGSSKQQEAKGSAVKDPPQPSLPASPPPPRFEDIEALLLSGAAASLPPVDEAGLVSSRSDFIKRLSLVGRLEQSALGATCRQLDALGGLAVLCGRRRRYVLRRAAVAIGRCTESWGKVDVDLSEEADGECLQRVSRQQAQLFLETDGCFRLRCTGRRAMLVNGRMLARGQTAALPSLSHIKAGDVSLLFIANTAAAARAVASSVHLMV